MKYAVASCYPSFKVPAKLAQIFDEAYRELRPNTSAPPMHVRFYPFVSINNTIRLRQGELYIRLSDLIEGAPEAVLYSIAHILLAKLYRKPVDRTHSARYRRYVAGHEVAAKARLVRQTRGRKHIRSARGHYYHWRKSSTTSIIDFFTDLWVVRSLPGAGDHARRSLGHYDPAHNTIVISRVFDHPRVPRYAIEYIMFHEMLHLKHPVRLRGSRRCVHSREFLEEKEKQFAELAQAKRFLRII